MRISVCENEFNKFSVRLKFFSWFFFHSVCIEMRQKLTKGTQYWGKIFFFFLDGIELIVKAQHAFIFMPFVTFFYAWKPTQHRSQACTIVSSSNTKIHTDSIKVTLHATKIERCEQFKGTFICLSILFSSSLSHILLVLFSILCMRDKIVNASAINDTLNKENKTERKQHLIVYAVWHRRRHARTHK